MKAYPLYSVAKLVQFVRVDIQHLNSLLNRFACGHQVQLAIYGRHIGLRYWDPTLSHIA